MMACLLPGLGLRVGGGWGLVMLACLLPGLGLKGWGGWGLVMLACLAQFFRLGGGRV